MNPTEVIKCRPKLSTVDRIRQKKDLFKPEKSGDSASSSPRKDSNGVSLPVKRFGPKPTLTCRQKEELTIAFGEFDPRGSGLIDSRSYIIALRAMGFEPKVEKVQAFIDEIIGSCGKESLDFKEFHKLMAIKMLGDDKRTELNRMFREFTNDEAGGITLQHLTNVARELGEDISQDELVEMITFADADNDGTVSFEEFMKIMERPELE